MANEITLNVSMAVVNAKLKASFAPGTLQVTQAAVGGHFPIISVGTSDEAIDDGDVGTLGYVAFRNLDSTNYVDIGPDSGGAIVPMIRLEAGDVAIMRVKPGITMRAQANTAAVKLQMFLLED